MRFPTGVLAVAVLVGVLMAGGPAAGVAQAGQPASVVPAEPITIEVWWHEYGPFTAYVKELIEAYK
jgi:ABC-type glycerol-3-phosphate transport system substrate-binding protein